MLCIDLCRNRKRKIVQEPDARDTCQLTDDDVSATDQPVASVTKSSTTQLKLLLQQKDAEIEDLKTRLLAAERSMRIMSFDSLKVDEMLLSHYVGLRGKATFMSIFEFYSRFSVSTPSW